MSRMPWRATDRRNWRELLGNQYPASDRWLRSTGRVVSAIDCPFPSGNRCPRKVVRHTDDRLVAVCGDRPPRCDRVDLLPDDIDVLEFDPLSLAADLRALLHISPPRNAQDAGSLVEIGMLSMQAGADLAVMAAFPAGGEPSALHLPKLKPEQVGGLVLTAEGSFPGVLEGDWHELAMADLFGADDTALVLTDRGMLAIEAVKEKTLLAFSSRDTAAWRLPADAAWGELTVEFVADEVLNVRFRGNTRRFEPEQLGMKDGRNGRPSHQWDLLKIFASGGGAIQAAKTEQHEKFVKQKQELSRKLRSHFGIQSEPIPYDQRSRTFQTAFIIRGHSLRRGQDEFSS